MLHERQVEIFKRIFGGGPREEGWLAHPSLRLADVPPQHRLIVSHTHRLMTRWHVLANLNPQRPHGVPCPPEPIGTQAFFVLLQLFQCLCALWASESEDQGAAEVQIPPFDLGACLALVAEQLN